MTIESLGAWPKAPLVYIIASIRFYPISISNEKRGEIFDQFSALLYEKFPVRTDANSFSVAFNAEHPEESKSNTSPVLFLQSKNKRARVGLTSDHFFLDATEYSNEREFIQQFSDVLTNAWSVIENHFGSKPQVSRIGLRYVDLLVPEDGERELDNYLTSNLRIEIGTGVSPTRTEWLVHFPGTVDKFTSSLKVKYIGSTDKKVLPPDILGGSALLEPPEVMRRPISNEIQVASLDFDHVVEDEDLPNDAVALISLFSELKQCFPLSIRDLATKHALKKWGAK